MIKDNKIVRKILIVEDDAFSRLYLNKILTKTGADLINAGDGIEAVKAFEANPDIDLILMDIQLPLMDGYDAAKSIRSMKQDIIIIAQTAYGMQADRQKIMNAGFNDFFIKPVIADVLLKKIEMLFA